MLQLRSRPTTANTQDLGLAASRCRDKVRDSVQGSGFRNWRWGGPILRARVGNLEHEVWGLMACVWNHLCHHSGHHSGHRSRYTTLVYHSGHKSRHRSRCHSGIDCGSLACDIAVHVSDLVDGHRATLAEQNRLHALRVPVAPQGLGQHRAQRTEHSP